MSASSLKLFFLRIRPATLLLSSVSDTDPVLVGPPESEIRDRKKSGSEMNILDSLMRIRIRGLFDPGCKIWSRDPG
jgi:hypothetical protein